MAITDYITLKQSVENWVLRTDSPFETIVSLAEERMNEDLRVDLMLLRECVTLGDDEEQYIELPPKFLESYSFKIKDTDTDVPFKIIGNQLQLDKKYKNIEFEMIFYKKIDGITEQNTSNLIIGKYPKLYLYAVLSQFYVWADDDVNIQKYDTMYRDALMQINEADDKAWKLAQNLNTKFGSKK